MIQRCYLILCLIALLSACSSLSDDPNRAYAGQTEEQIYQTAQHALEKKNYTKAISALEALEALFPFSQYTEQAQLNLMYAYYMSDDFAATAATAKRFKQLYPRHAHVDYAYYMQGLANFEPAINLIERHLHVDVAKRDEQNTHEAFNNFNALILHFPNSAYSPDARQHMLFLRDEFARHELNIAQFYFDRKLYVAAANRASTLVSHYQRSPYVKAALNILINSYTELNLPEQARISRQIRDLNFS